MPITEALAMSLAQRALGGNIAAAREFMKIAEKVAAEQKVIEETPPGKLVITLVGGERKDCNTALEKLGAIQPFGSRYIIAPWVVEAALARNGALLDDEADRKIIEENMLDPQCPYKALRYSKAEEN
jgi:hypothetical protein